MTTTNAEAGQQCQSTVAAPPDVLLRRLRARELSALDAEALVLAAFLALWRGGIPAVRRDDAVGPWLPRPVEARWAATRRSASRRRGRGAALRAAVLRRVVPLAVRCRAS